MNKLAAAIMLRNKTASPGTLRYLASGLGGGLKGGLVGGTAGTLLGLGIRPSLNAAGLSSVSEGLGDLVNSLKINDLRDAGAIAALSATLGGVYKGAKGAKSSMDSLRAKAMLDDARMLKELRR